MTRPLAELTSRDLQELAAALRSGRLSSPYGALAVSHVLGPQNSAPVAAALEELRGLGFTAEPLAQTLDLIRADRERRPRLEHSLELVTTGPEVDGTATRDTAVVVRELFANASSSVLVAGYAVYQGQRVFQALADRMQQVPDLEVRLFLDIQRAYGDTTASAEIVRRFAKRFAESEWPKDRPLPRVFFDPRSLNLETTKRACLHAKLVVVDNRHVFVSSANLTEAAQQRNIEVGVLFDSRVLAGQLTRFFDSLLASRALHPL